MHPSDEILTAYRDAELPQAERASAREHLDTCSDCSARLNALLQTSARIAMLAPPAAYHVSPQAALQQFTNRRKENPMKKLIRKPAFFAAGLVVILAVALAFPPVQAFANSFLGLFRVQQVRVVAVDPTAAQQYSTVLENNSARFQSMFSQNLVISHSGEYQKFASQAEAATAGFTPRLPANAKLVSLEMNPAETADLTIDSALMNSLLDALGRKDVTIPANLDGQKIHADIPSVTMASFGECALNKQNGGPESAPRQQAFDCTQLIQFKSPTIQAPESFPVVQLAQTMLQLSGMSAEQASQFSQTVDWASTLVIPVPTSRFSKISDVTVDGVSGTLVSASNNTDYSLIWVKNGFIYALIGHGDPTAGLEMANSLR